jgi:hypothetical protein
MEGVRWGISRPWEQPAVAEKEIKPATPAPERRTIQHLMYPKTFQELILKSRLLLKYGKK